jgi:hypothetical protein
MAAFVEVAHALDLSPVRFVVDDGQQYVDRLEDPVDRLRIVRRAVKAKCRDVVDSLFVLSFVLD